jgi:site-specific recombinase XerD
MNFKELQSAPTILKDFLTYIGTIKGKSEKTVDEYYLDLRTFFRFLKLYYGIVPYNTEFTEIPIQDVNISLIERVTLSDIYQFLTFCDKERHNSGTTRARKVSCLKTFFKYLCGKTNQLSENPTQELDAPKTRRALPKYLTLEQSLELLGAVDGPFKERDYCILTILLNCGLRLSELVSINLRDVDSANDNLYITGKGNKQRLIYLNDACKNAISEYLKVRPVEGVIDRDALFISKQKKRISREMVQKMVYKYLQKIGLGQEGYSVHKLRHTAATLMYQHGNVDIRTLQDFLGHENLSTTEIYTHVSSQKLKDAASANPLSTVKKKPSSEEN